MNPWTPIGPHSLRHEGDLVFIRLCGLLTMPDAQVLVATLAQVRQEHGRLYVLFDGSQVSGIEPAVRKMFVEWSREHPLAAVANFGGGVMQRALAFLLNNAIRLVVKKATPFTYVSTEAEARAWLDQQRRQPPP